MKVLDRLFIGVYPGGIVYADKNSYSQGDYKQIAFLPYDTLVPKYRKVRIPPALRRRVEEHIRSMQARRGERYPLDSSGSNFVILGERLSRKPW